MYYIAVIAAMARSVHFGNMYPVQDQAICHRVIKRWGWSHAALYVPNLMNA